MYLARVAVRARHSEIGEVVGTTLGKPDGVAISKTFGKASKILYCERLRGGHGRMAIIKKSNHEERNR